MLIAIPHSSSLPAPIPAATLRVLGTGLALLVWLGQAVAQDDPVRAAPRSIDRDNAWLAATAAVAGDGAAVRPTFDLSTVRSRLPVPVATSASVDARMASDLVGVNYRLWMSRGRADIGVGVGTLGYLLPAVDGRDDTARALVGAVPTLNLGLRWRMSNEHLVYADASGARGLGGDPALAYYTTKVGVEWKPAKSKFGLEHGALGLQFDSGFKLSVKAHRGGPSLYLRSQF